MVDPTTFAGLTDADLKQVLADLEAEKRRAARLAKLEDYRPYPKQIEFHNAGLLYRERMLSAGNQLGKTYSGAAEAAMHLTGRYPPWWNGRRFTHPITMLAGSVTAENTKNGMQTLLLGPPQVEEEWGTGLIPNECITDHPKRRPGTKDAVDAINVRHAQGGISTIQFKSFDQGRKPWQSASAYVIWLDEEAPSDIYEEAISRANAKLGGMIYTTFTPLEGFSKIVLKFFQEPGNDRHLTRMEIEDVPSRSQGGHLDPEEKARIIASYDDHTRDARTRGLPSMGSGAIFPVTREMIKISPFSIPDHWSRIAAIDFGWDHPTAAIEAAWDRDTDTIYFIREYRQNKRTPAEHTFALRDWGNHLTWVWPHDGNAAEKGTGLNLAHQYREAGLRMHDEHVTFPDGTIAVEAGIMEMLTRMREGKLKVFETLSMWFDELDLYRRDKDGKIVKEKDDLISASRYAMMGRRFGRAASRRPTWAGRGRGTVAAGTGEVQL